MKKKEKRGCTPGGNKCSFARPEEKQSSQRSALQIMFLLIMKTMHHKDKIFKYLMGSFSGFGLRKCF